MSYWKSKNHNDKQGMVLLESATFNNEENTKGRIKNGDNHE